MSFVVSALPDNVIEMVRQSRRSPGYGHPVTEEPAKGYGPCRACLQPFDTDRDRRLLFTYNPFDGLGPIPSPGPIFIHRHDCQRFEGNGFPEGLRSLPLFFEAYRHDGSIGEQIRVPGEQVEAAISKLLACDDVAFIHVRNYEVGCFIARIDRTTGAVA